LFGIWSRLKAWEKRYHMSFYGPIDTPEDRKRAEFFAKWVDHGFLRELWYNLDKVTEGVYRSNHPSPERLKKYREMGIRTILNLRGGRYTPTAVLSNTAAEELGFAVVSIGMSARETPDPEIILTLLDTFETIEKPFLMHCKSGADRTGLAAAIYLIVHENKSVAEARKQLGVRYLHLKFTKTGVLDRFLDLYEAAQSKSGIGFRDWVKTEYDPEVLGGV
jgi:protein tyrosine phosphatase (PTP) superfamily phosphohydrolase (DUF442 family)